MNVIERLTDVGTVTSAADEWSVNYDLLVTEENGLGNVVGRITPGRRPRSLTISMLTMADGRKLKFSFRNEQGDIDFVEWIR